MEEGGDSVFWLGGGTGIQSRGLGSKNEDRHAFNGEEK
jgi:hypothetical protein